MVIDTECKLVNDPDRQSWVRFGSAQISFRESADSPIGPGEGCHGERPARVLPLVGYARTSLADLV